MTKRIGALAFILALCYPACQSAYAAGTASGTSITNTATATYKDGGETVTKTASAPSIIVDNKVNLTVTSNGGATVIPGAEDQAIPFTVKNEGNTTQRYALQYVNSNGIALDNVRIYLDNGTTPGTLDGGDTLYINAATFGDVLAEGSLKVIVVTDIPAGALSGNTADYQLVATTVNAGTTTVTTPTVGANTAGVDVVFADIAGDAAGDILRDGKHSDTGTYTVNLLTLTLTKEVLIFSDPQNGTVNPKAIPGAVLLYTIKATVSGVGTLTDVVITDPIPINSTYVPVTLTLNGGGLSDDADLDVGSVVGSPKLLTVGLGPLTNLSSTQVVTFKVTID